MSDVNANINIDIDSSGAVANLNALQESINRFNRSISSANSAAMASQQAWNKQLLQSINSTGLFNAKVVDIHDSVNQFTKSLESGKLSLSQYGRYIGSQMPMMSRVFKKEFDTITQVAESRVKKIQTQYVALGKTVDGVTRAIASTPTNLQTGYATDLAVAAQRQQIFNKLIDDGSTKLLNWGKNTQWAGRQLMVGFTIPLAALGTVSAKTFMEIDKANLSLRRVYGDLSTTTEEIDRNAEAISKLGTEYTKYGISLSDTIGIAARAAATGAQNETLMAATEETLRFATLGQIDYQQALDTTISLQTAFGVSNEDLANKIDFLNAVENQTILTIEDMSLAIPRVATVVKGLGGDVEDLAIMMTAMREGGVSAENAANGLKSGLASLINPTKRATESLAGMGINITEIVNKNKGDLMGLITDFANATNALDEFSRQQVFEQVFGKYQYARMSALFTNITDGAGQAARAMELAGKSAEELASISSKELNAISETTSVKFQAAMEKLKVSIAPLGEAFLKGITPIVELVTKIAEIFNNLPDPVKNAMAVITAAVAGLGPIILMSIGLIGNGIANIVKAVQFFRKMLASVKGDASAFEFLAASEYQALDATQKLNVGISNLNNDLLIQKNSVNSLANAYFRFATAANIAGNAVSTMPGANLTTRSGSRGRRSTSNPELLTLSKGGSVPGTGNKDTIPALLTPGESVITKQATQKYGPVIDAMNNGSLPGFNKGVTGVQYFGNESQTSPGGKVQQPPLPIPIMQSGELHRSHMAGMQSQNLPDTLRGLITYSESLPDGNLKQYIEKVIVDMFNTIIPTGTNVQGSGKTGKRGVFPGGGAAYAKLKGTKARLSKIKNILFGSSPQQGPLMFLNPHSYDLVNIARGADRNSHFLESGMRDIRDSQPETLAASGEALTIDQWKIQVKRAEELTKNEELLTELVRKGQEEAIEKGIEWLPTNEKVLSGARDILEENERLKKLGILDSEELFLKHRITDMLSSSILSTKGSISQDDRIKAGQDAEQIVSELKTSGILDEYQKGQLPVKALVGTVAARLSTVDPLVYGKKSWFGSRIRGMDKGLFRTQVSGDSRLTGITRSATMIGPLTEEQQSQSDERERIKSFIGPLTEEQQKRKEKLKKKKPIRQYNYRVPHLRSILPLLGIDWMNNGGQSQVIPGTGNTDTVPAMLTPGEFVVNKQSTQRNLGLLHAINDGDASNIPGYNKGGFIQNFSKAGQVLSQSAQASAESGKRKYLRRLLTGWIGEPNSLDEKAVTHILSTIPDSPIYSGPLYRGFRSGESSLLPPELTKAIRAIEYPLNDQQRQDAIKSIIGMEFAMEPRSWSKGLKEAELFGTSTMILNEPQGGQFGLDVNRHKDPSSSLFENELEFIPLETSGSRLMIRVSGIDFDEKGRVRLEVDRATDLSQTRKKKLENQLNKRVVARRGSLIGKRSKKHKKEKIEKIKNLTGDMATQRDELISFFRDIESGNRREEISSWWYDHVDVSRMIFGDDFAERAYKFGINNSPESMPNIPGLTRKETLKALGLDGIAPIQKFSNGGDVAAIKAFATRPLFESAKKTFVPGAGNKDTVPAALTPGEFVINKQATADNLPLLQAINSGNYVAANSGGLIPGLQYFGLGSFVKSIGSRFKGRRKKPASRTPLDATSVSTGMVDKDMQDMLAITPDEYDEYARLIYADQLEDGTDIDSVISERKAAIFGDDQKPRVASLTVDPQTKISGAEKGSSLRERDMLTAGHSGQLFEISHAKRLKSVYEELKKSKSPHVEGLSFEQFLKKVVSKGSTSAMQTGLTGAAETAVSRDPAFIKEVNQVYARQAYGLNPEDEIRLYRSETEFSGSIRTTNKEDPNVTRSESEDRKRKGQREFYETGEMRAAGFFTYSQRLASSFEAGSPVGRPLVTTTSTVSDLPDIFNSSGYHDERAFVLRPEDGKVETFVYPEDRTDGLKYLDLQDERSKVSSTLDSFIDNANRQQESGIDVYTDDFYKERQSLIDQSNQLEQQQKEIKERVQERRSSKVARGISTKEVYQTREIPLSEVDMSAVEEWKKEKPTAKSGGILKINPDTQSYYVDMDYLDSHALTEQDISLIDLLQERLGFTLVDRKTANGLEPAKLNSGNLVPGMGNTDTVPAMLTPGEFVVNKQSTAENLPLLRAINNGRSIAMNKGGHVPGLQYFATGDEVLDPRLKRESGHIVAPIRVTDPEEVLALAQERVAEVERAGRSTVGAMEVVTEINKEIARATAEGSSPNLYANLFGNAIVDEPKFANAGEMTGEEFGKFLSDPKRRDTFMDPFVKQLSKGLDVAFKDLPDQTQEEIRTTLDMVAQQAGTNLGKLGSRLVQDEDFYAAFEQPLQQAVGRFSGYTAPREPDKMVQFSGNSGLQHKEPGAILGPTGTDISEAMKSVMHTPTRVEFKIDGKRVRNSSREVMPGLPPGQQAYVKGGIPGHWGTEDFQDVLTPEGDALREDKARRRAANAESRRVGDAQTRARSDALDAAEESSKTSQEEIQISKRKRKKLNHEKRVNDIAEREIAKLGPAPSQPSAAAMAIGPAAYGVAPYQEYQGKVTEIRKQAELEVQRDMQRIREQRSRDQVREQGRINSIIIAQRREQLMEENPEINRQAATEQARADVFDDSRRLETPQTEEQYDDRRTRREARPTRREIISEKIGRHSGKLMVAGGAAQMASMIPFTMANEQGKFMGMDANLLGTGMMAAGGAAEIAPLLLKGITSHPLITALALAAAAAGAGLWKWRDIIDNAAKETAEVGANMGGTANALNNMAALLGTDTPNQRKAKMQLGFTTEQQQQAALQFKPMLESETGQKFIKDLESATSADRFKKLSDYLKTAIASGMMDVESANLFSKTIANALSDPILGQSVIKSISGQKAGGSAMLGLAQKRESGVIAGDQLRILNENQTVEEGTASSVIGSSIQLIQDFSNASSLAKEELVAGTISYSKYREIVDQSTAAQEKYTQAINDSFNKTQDFGATMQAWRDQLILSGKNEDVINLLEQSATTTTGGGFGGLLKTLVNPLSAPKAMISEISSGQTSSMEMIKAYATGEVSTTNKDLISAITSASTKGNMSDADIAAIAAEINTNPGGRAAQEFKKTNDFEMAALEMILQQGQIPGLKTLSSQFAYKETAQNFKTAGFSINDLNQIMSIASEKNAARMTFELKGLSENEISSVLSDISQLSTLIGPEGMTKAINILLNEKPPNLEDKLPELEKNIRLISENIPNDVQKRLGIVIDSPFSAEEWAPLASDIGSLIPILDSLPEGIRIFGIDLLLRENGKSKEPEEYLKDIQSMQKSFNKLSSKDIKVRKNAIIDFLTIAKDQNGKMIKDPTKAYEDMKIRIDEEYGKGTFEKLPPDTYLKTIQFETEIKGLEALLLAQQIARGGTPDTIERLVGKLQSLKKDQLGVAGAGIDTSDKDKGGGGGQENWLQMLKRQAQEALKIFNMFKNIAKNQAPAFKNFISGPFAPEFIRFLQEQGIDAVKVLKGSTAKFKEAYDAFVKKQQREAMTGAVLFPIEIMQQRKQQFATNALKGRMSSKGINAGMQEQIMSKLGTSAPLAASGLNKLDLGKTLDDLSKAERKAVELFRTLTNKKALKEMQLLNDELIKMEKTAATNTLLFAQMGVPEELANVWIEQGYNVEDFKDAINGTDLALKKTLESLMLIQKINAFTKLTNELQSTARQAANAANVMKLLPNASQELVDNLSQLDPNLFSDQDIVKYAGALDYLKNQQEKAKTSSTQLSEQLSAQAEAWQQSIEKINRLEIRPFENAIKSIQDYVEGLSDQIENIQRNLIRPLEDQIDELQDKVGVIQDQIDELQKVEDETNKVYDKRIAALNKVFSINERIASQQKSQLSLAEALSSGDIYAAAQAMQEINDQDAAYAREDLMAGLETEKENAILAIQDEIATKQKEIEAINGQIEERQKSIETYNRNIRDIQDQIFIKQKEIAAIQKQIEEAKRRQLELEEKIYAVQLAQSAIEQKKKYEDALARGDVGEATAYASTFNASLEILKTMVGILPQELQNWVNQSLGTPLDLTSIQANVDRITAESAAKYSEFIATTITQYKLTGDQLTTAFQNAGTKYTEALLSSGKDVPVRLNEAISNLIEQAKTKELTPEKITETLSTAGFSKDQINQFLPIISAAVTTVATETTKVGTETGKVGTEANKLAAAVTKISTIISGLDVPLGGLSEKIKAFASGISSMFATDSATGKDGKPAPSAMGAGMLQKISESLSGLFATADPNLIISQIFQPLASLFNADTLDITPISLIINQIGEAMNSLIEPLQIAFSSFVEQLSVVLKGSLENIANSITAVAVSFLELIRQKLNGIVVSFNPNALKVVFPPVTYTLKNGSTGTFEGAVVSGNVPNVKSSAAVPALFAGGPIIGSGSRDSIPLMAAPGEFIMRRAAVDKYGSTMLSSMNTGSYSIPKYDIPEVSTPSITTLDNRTNIMAPVYNTYSVNVPVTNPGASADEIANKVMVRMQRLDSSNIRSIRGNK
jgi:TP901 family phage tail tape measure protein